MKAIITARIASTRLDRKMLRDLHGSSLVSHVITRCHRFPEIAHPAHPTDIVLAIPDSDENNDLAALGSELGVHVFRGSEDNVLSRILGAAKMVDAEAVYRVTGDNPLVDPGVVSGTFHNFISSRCDYSVMEDTPLGTTAEIVTVDALERAYELAVESGQEKYLEHPTLALYENNANFKMSLIPAPPEWTRPGWRFTVDTEDDFSLVKSIMNELGVDATLNEIVPFIDANPDLLKFNSNVAQQGWKSLKEKKDIIRHV